MSTSKLLTIKEVCEILNLSVPTIYRWEAQGRLPFPKLKIGPGSVRFRESDVLAHIERAAERTGREWLESRPHANEEV